MGSFNITPDAPCKEPVESVSSCWSVWTMW